MRLIVKIQQPLNDNTGPLLIYDKSRRFQLTVVKTPHLMRALGERPKIYAIIAVKAGEVRVLEVVKDRHW